MRFRSLSQYILPGMTWFRDVHFRNAYVSLRRLEALVQEGRDTVSDEEALQDYALRRSLRPLGALREGQTTVFPALFVSPFVFSPSFFGSLYLPLAALGAFSLGVLFDGISLLTGTEQPRASSHDTELLDSPTYFWQRLGVEASVYEPRPLSEVGVESSYWRDTFGVLKG